MILAPKKLKNSCLTPAITHNMNLVDHVEDKANKCI